MKKNKFLIVVLIVIIILIILSVKTAFSKKKKVDIGNLTEEEITAYIDNKISNIEKKDLSNLGERDRMEFYVSKFIENIENENYDKAYDMLNSGFKKNYFKTFNEFEEYAGAKFPKMAAIDYTNFERNGDLYVLWTRFSDSLGSKDSYKDIRFVVKENDLNDYELSFSVEL